MRERATAWLDRAVDALPHRWSTRLGAVAAGASLLTFLIIGAVAFFLLRASEAERSAAFGRAIAEELAALSVEPLLSGDRILLGVLASRMAELDRIGNVAVVTIDDRVLADSGAEPRPSGPEFTAPILLDGDLAGYVHVVLDGTALGPRRGELLWIAIAALFVIALCAALGRGLGVQITRRARRIEMMRLSKAANDEERPHERFVIVVNLFNQLSLPSADRHKVIDACVARVAAVGRLYGGRCEPLPGTGAVMRLDGFTSTPPEASPSAASSPSARAFDALCAALLAVDVVGELAAAPPIETRQVLDFRVAAHTLSLPADPLDETESVNDAVLLSAVAQRLEVAVSHDLFLRLEQPERFGPRSHENPALHALTTARRGSCMMVGTLDEELRELLDAQVDKLISVAPSTSSPSAF